MTLCRLLAATAAALVAVALSSSPAAAQDARGWTQQLDVDLSARELGLPPGAAASRLARAALERNARRLGLRRSSGLRLASRFRPPRSSGGRALRMLRFHQTASGLRVVWSQIDVTIAAGEVSSISATVVPVGGHALPGERKVSRARALRIARRAVPSAEAVLRPLPAAYAGSPSSGLTGGGAPGRSGWSSSSGPPRPARTRGRGSASSSTPERARSSRAGPASPTAPTADPTRAVPPLRGRPAAARPADSSRTRESRPLDLWDATGKDAPPPIGEDFYAEFRTTGNTRLRSSWPSALAARDPFAEPSADMDAITANAASAAREVCVVRGWCGKDGAWQPGAARVSPGS